MRNAIIIASIFIVLLVAGCQQQQQEQAPPEQPPQQNVDQNPPATSIPPELEPPSCEDWAKSLMPKRIRVHEGAGSCEREMTATWLDDRPVRLVGRNLEFVNGKNKQFVISPGSEVGESPTKYYLKTFNGEKPTLGYERAVYDEDAVLVGYDRFEVRVDNYDRIDSSMEEAEGFGCFYYEYMLGDYIIEQCEKVSQ